MTEVTLGDFYWLAVALGLVVSFGIGFIAGKAP